MHLEGSVAHCEYEGGSMQTLMPVYTGLAVSCGQLLNECLGGPANARV